MASTSGGGSTKELKRVLGFKELFSTAVGQIIGAGIMSLMGAAIAQTGRSICIAFFIAAALTLLTGIPSLLVSGAVRVRGGSYTVAGMLAGKQASGLWVIFFLFANISLGMYGLSFAEYFVPFFGFGNVKVIAIIILTLFFILNLFGIDKMAKVQNIIVVLMCIALGLLAAFGLGKVQPDFFTEGFTTNGIVGILSASTLLTYAVQGASVVVNLSGESKNPTKDIPRVILLSTFAVTALYAVIGIVASGVLPVDQVANQSMSVVAEYVLPAPAYAFFMVGGAMFAIATSLNAQFAWATKPLLQACDDGWFPKKLGYLHPKYKTPVVLLVILYAFGVIFVITGFDIGTLGNLGVIFSNLINFVIVINLYKIPKLIPKEWENSKFKVGKKMLYLLIILSLIATAITVGMSFASLTLPLFIANVIAITAAYIYTRIRMKHINLEISYEAV